MRFPFMDELNPEELRKKAEREKLLEAYGYDPKDRVRATYFQELEAQHEAGTITKGEVLRRMQAPPWKDLEKHPELAQKIREEQIAFQREQEGRQHDQTGGRRQY
jgi:hypothetical protein